MASWVMHVVAETGYRGFAFQGLRNLLHRRLEIPVLVRALRLPSGCDALETGCGAGIGLTALAETCHPVSLTGVEIDRDLLEHASARFLALGLAVNLVNGDARQLPFNDESFDLVVDFGTLYHVQPAQQAINEIARVLRSGGVLVHETRLSQLLAHPFGSSRGRLPWHLAPQLGSRRSAGLWACRVKEVGPARGCAA